MCRGLSPILVLTMALAARGDEQANTRRLESMPREQRVHLSEVLERFDALPADEKAAIRRLDADLSKLEPAVQARYRIVLRRYHVWLKGLTDVRKKELDRAATVDERIKLVGRWRKEERLADTRSKADLVLGVHPGDLGTFPPFEMANALRVWFTLDGKDKARIEAMATNRERFDEIRRLGQQKARSGLIQFRRFPLETEEALLKKLEEEAKVRNVFTKFARKAEKKADASPLDAEAKKKAGLGPAIQLGLNNPFHHLAETIYFNEHPPDRVSPENLTRFEAEIPDWLRSSFDPLPPEDARRRLTILYRQIYPLPDEIKPPTKAESAKPKEAPRPSPPKGGGSTQPF